MLSRFVLFFLLCSLSCLCDNLKTIALFLHGKEREFIKSCGLSSPSYVTPYRALLVQSESLPTASYDTRLRRILARPFTKVPAAASAILAEYRNATEGAERQRLFCAFRREIIAAIERTLMAISLKGKLLKNPKVKRSVASSTSGGRIDPAGRISVPPTGPNSNFNNSEEDEESYFDEASSPIDLDSQLIEEEEDNFECTLDVQCDGNLHLQYDDCGVHFEALDQTSFCVLNCGLGGDQVQDRCDATLEVLNEANVQFIDGIEEFSNNSIVRLDETEVSVEDSIESLDGAEMCIENSNGCMNLSQFESDRSIVDQLQLDSDTDVRYIDQSQLESETSIRNMNQSQLESETSIVNRSGSSQDYTNTSIANRSNSFTNTSIVNLTQDHTNTSIVNQTQDHTNTSIVNQSNSFTNTSIINLNQSQSPTMSFAHTPSQNNPTRVRKIPNSTSDSDLSIRKIPTTINKRCSSEKSNFYFDDQKQLDFSNVLIRNYLSDRNSKKNDSVGQSSSNYSSYSPRTEDVKRKLIFASDSSESPDFSGPSAEFNVQSHESFDQHLLNISNNFEEFENIQHFPEMVKIQYKHQQEAKDFYNLLDRVHDESVSSDEHVEFDCEQSANRELDSAENSVSESEIQSDDYSESESEIQSNTNSSQNTVIVKRESFSRNTPTPGRLFWNNPSGNRIESMRRNNPRVVIVSSYGSDSLSEPQRRPSRIERYMREDYQNEFFKSHPRPIRIQNVEVQPLSMRTRIWNWIKSLPLINAFCSPVTQ